VSASLESPQNLNDFAPENLNTVKHLDFAICETKCFSYFYTSTIYSQSLSTTKNQEKFSFTTTLFFAISIVKILAE
jgi:hypothetical protein